MIQRDAKCVIQQVFCDRFSYKKFYLFVCIGKFIRNVANICYDTYTCLIAKTCTCHRKEWENINFVRLYGSTKKT
jgi:hypothetical protein